MRKRDEGAEPQALPYDREMIQEVLHRVQSLPQITAKDMNALFPPNSPIDIIADEAVNYPGRRVVEHRFKGMINKPQPVPLVIRLYSDSSRKKIKHTLVISHSLDVRASDDFATTRRYEIGQSYADQIAGLHGRFYSTQDPNHVYQVSRALEERQLRPGRYVRQKRHR